MHMQQSSHPAGRRPARAALLAAIVVVLGLSMPVRAQLGLPGPQAVPGLPALPGFPAGSVRATVPRLTGAAPTQALTEPVSRLSGRLSVVRALLRDHAGELEPDPAGEPVRRRELLLVAPAPGTVAAALALGFTVLRETGLVELDLRHVVVQPPPGWSTSEALARLRAVDPQLEADYNHVYTFGGDTSAAVRPDAPAASGARQVGMLDGGVDHGHPALRGIDVRSGGCPQAAAPDAHGTAVASLLAGPAGSVLYAADIYCARPAGGAAEAIAAGLAWMAREQVGVVNISLVGPANRLLQRAVEAMLRKGHLIVAAVGNDGPAAPALYPASYPGVVGVTGVTRARRVLPEAAQGPQVMFAAPGAELAVAQPAGGYGTARGTSFASPKVAGLLADSLRAPDREQAAVALARLTAAAIDLGAPGRDPVFGIGLVGDTPPGVPASVRADRY